MMFLVLSAARTTQSTTTTKTYSSSATGSVSRMKPKLQPTGTSIEPPSTALLRAETSASIEPFSSSTTRNDFMTYALSSTLRNNDSSNTTILVVILVCSFTGFLFLALILTFLLRYSLQFEWTDFRSFSSRLDVV